MRGDPDTPAQPSVPPVRGLAQPEFMLLAVLAQKYAAVILMGFLWIGIVLGVRGMLRWLSEQSRDSLGF